jgi:hypothetical protein
MRFQLVTGPVFSVSCQGCDETKQAGSEPFVSAATGLADGEPDKVYEDIEAVCPHVYYCEACAVAHVEANDPTKSVKQFFADTHGEIIL